MNLCLVEAWKTICSGVSFPPVLSLHIGLTWEVCLIQAICIVVTGGSYFQPLSWSLRLKVALDAAKGLAFLHSAEAKVIYRDFKTSNVLLDSVCGLLIFSFNI